MERVGSIFVRLASYWMFHPRKDLLFNFRRLLFNFRRHGILIV